MGERVHKSLMNAEVNLLFYFLSLFLTFFSRKIFLDNLGAEFIGLTGTLNNILGYLNLSELGISACIGYFLFKPLQSNNRQEIQDILSLLGFLYNRIGAVIFGGAFLVSLFFPLIFAHASLSLGIIYFAFYSFLGSSLIGYFINYRQILLSADQKNYLVAIYYQSANLIKLALQIFLAYHYKNLYVWVAVEFLFGILGCIILNWKINKEYPWLHVDKSRGRLLLKQYPEIITKTRQVFIHKIKDFMLVKSDEIFIFAFVSLKMVAFYGNYMLIINKTTLLFHSVLESVNAGIGNLVAENDRKKTMDVFWELMTIRHFVAGMLCYSIYHFFEPFIALWLGKEYIIEHRILVLLIIFIYIMNSRGVVDAFNHAHGLYADVWSAWAELIINISITIIGGVYWGIMGILLGKIVSLFFIVIFWKPYYLFKSGFRLPIAQYWNGAVRYYIISAIAFIGGSILTRYIPVSPQDGYLQWICYSILSLIAWFIIETTLLILFAKGARQCIQRIKHLRK